MSTMKRTSTNLLYLQSGGPTAVINSSFAGLVKAFQKDKNHGHFYYSHYGVKGLSEGKLVEVDLEKVPILSFRPGSYTGSLRKKLPSDSTDPFAEKILKTLIKYQIDVVFFNGGNDSMDSAATLASYVKERNLPIKVFGIPKTIDNDLTGCDHTPGFGTAAKFVANSTIAIGLDDLSYEKGRVNIIETMGRDSGFVTASAVLASLKGIKPDYIYVPEVPFSIPDFLAKCKATYSKKGHCLVVVSEGIRDKDGTLIATDSIAKDAFNNRQVGGVGKYLASLIAQEGIKTRGIELSLLNRASSFLPSLTDIKEAEGVASEAYRCYQKGLTGVMVTLGRKKEEKYAPLYGTIALEKAKDIARTLPKKYINKAGDNISASYIDYVLPLIQGNAIPLSNDGLLNIGEER